MAKIPTEIAKRVEDYVTKYMKILDIGGKRPSIKVYNKPGADWIARLDQPFFITDDAAGIGANATLELQKEYLKYPKFLARVIAHEMVHLRDFRALPKDEAARMAHEIAAGVMPEEHPASFFEGVARIDAIMGPDFVITEKGASVEEEAPDHLTSRHEPVLPKVLVGLALGVLGGVAIKRLRGKQERLSPHVPPSAAQPTRSYERGSYGGPRPRKSPSAVSMPTPPARGALTNERGHYGKQNR